MDMLIQEDFGQIKLSGSFDIYSAEALRLRLLTSLNASSELVLDLRDVRACDTAAIQILWAARAAAVARGKTPSFLDPSEAVRDLWAALGMPADFFTSSTLCNP